MLVLKDSGEAAGTATRCRRLHMEATTGSSSGCSRAGPTTRREEGTATRCRRLLPKTTTKSPAAARERGRRQRAGRSVRQRAAGGFGQGPRPDRPATQISRTISMTLLTATYPTNITFQCSLEDSSKIGSILFFVSEHRA